MNATSLLGYAYDTSKEFGVIKPEAASKAQAPQKIIPWSYSILAGSAITSAIIAIAGYIIGQNSLFAGGALMSLSSGLGAYEVKELALTKEFQDLLVDYKDLIDQFVRKVKVLAGENKTLDESNKKFKTQINELSAVNKKMEELTEELKKTDELTNTEIENLKVQFQELKRLKEDLEKQVGILITVKGDLENDLASLKNVSDSFGIENINLKENLENLKKSEETLQSKLKFFSEENQKLQESEKKAKDNILTISKKTDLIRQENESFQKALTTLRQTHQLLRKDTEKQDEVSNKLDITVEALSEKVNKKLLKMLHIKQENEQKIKDQQEALDRLTEENKKLKEDAKLKSNPQKLEHHITPSPIVLKTPDHSPRSHSHHASDLLPKALHYNADKEGT